MILVAPVGEGDDGDTAARVEVAVHLNVLGVHKLYQILHDDVDTVLMKVAVVAKREEVEL